jgi:basic membrane protein A and related proteins
MYKKLSVILAALLVFSMLLTACAPAPEAPVVEEAPAEEEAPMEEAATAKICQVTDVGGIDDKSFNATAWKGVEDAMTEFGVEGKYLESQQQTDYEKNLQAFVEEECDLIISVGFLLADATAAAAEANPEQQYATIDVDYLDFPNLRGSGFAINESTFLNGYLAAGMTETGVVATYVGIAFPATTVFMDGFVLGVRHYNEVHGTDVKVLGWDYEAQDGLQVGNFESLDDGRAMGESLMDEGADIIMPVAGPVGAGTLAVMEERGTGMLIGVDNDWSLAYAAQADYVLASAMKNMDKFVTETSGMVAADAFEAGNWIGTLENGGVGVAIGAAMGDKIPADLLAELADLEVQIIAGEIATK